MRIFYAVNAKIEGPQMETFAGMRLFAEVVDSGSFSAAGRRLGLAASSVARAIGTLENQLGVRLLNRTTRKLGLTEAGRLYHERSKRILAEVEEARLSVTQLETAPRGTLRLSVPVSFGRLHIAPALPDFLALHPALRVDLATTDAFVDLVEEGVDLAIRIGELEDSSLIARRLAPNRRVHLRQPRLPGAPRRSRRARGAGRAQLPDLQAPGEPLRYGACATPCASTRSRSGGPCSPTMPTPCTWRRWPASA